MEYHRFGVCHCFNLRRAGNKVTAMYNKKIAEAGLSGSQFSILSYIGHYEPINISRLSELLFLERTTVVRNLKLLEKEDYIEYQKGHGRERLISLTDRGREKYHETYILWNQAQEELEAKLGAEGMEMFRTLIDLICKM